MPEHFDYLFEDGDTFILGNLKLDLQIVPGHTPGVLCFFFDAIGPEGPKRCGLIGGVGLSSIHPWYIEHFDFPKDLPMQMLTKVRALKSEHVDIHLGNHPPNNFTLEKREKMLEEERILQNSGKTLPASKNPFIDPSVWPAFLDDLSVRIEKVIRKEA